LAPVAQAPKSIYNTKCLHLESKSATIKKQENNVQTKTDKNMAKNKMKENQ